jgi:predicted subunit of tRNA(5-methylaminomethyl-2-thiouridylate) methyltransferase
MAGNVLEVLLLLLLLVVDEKRGGWVEVLLITFGVLTVTSRAVLTLARTVVIMLVLRLVRNVRGGNVELAVTDVFPSGNTGNSSTFCTYWSI